MSPAIDWDTLLEQWDHAEAMDRERESPTPTLPGYKPKKIEPFDAEGAALRRAVEEAGRQQELRKAKEAEFYAKVEAATVEPETMAGGINSPEKVAEEVESLAKSPIPFPVLLRKLGADGILEQIYGPIGGQVVKEKQRQLVREIAREDLATEKVSAEWKAPVPLGISTFLSVEPKAPSFHIQGLWPHGGMVLLNAAKKWGKTTNVRHTVECVLTGQPLYGQFEISSPMTRALVIDNELSQRQTWDMWKGSPLGDDQLVLWRLRESLSTLAIRDELVRKKLVKTITDTGADLLVIDPLGPLLRANAWEENSNTDVGIALDLLAEMAAEAGVTSMLIPHHTGHDGAHARGASVIGDKADAIWSGTLKRLTDPYGPRLFGAIGRSGVSQRPLQLEWDEATRTPYLPDNAEAIAAKSYDDIRELVTAARSEGLIYKTHIRDYVRKHGGSAGNEVIDSYIATEQEPEM